MKVVLQRVTEAHVTVDGGTVGSIRKGLVIFVGIAKPDSNQEADQLLEKILHLRIFPDEAGKMNRNIQEAGGSLLVVSQFTLYGDCSKGRRPSFDRAAPPDQARSLYDYFVDAARRGPVAVETGEYRAHMEVHLVNDGPVTILIDTAEM
jgi:D-tyrosyl-tRNA(Tyr) deacylase